MHTQLPTNHSLPESLAIASPPLNQSLRRPVSSYFHNSEPRQWADRPYIHNDLPNPMAGSSGKRNWPALNASWKKGGRGSQEQERSPVQSLNSGSSASPSPNSPSSHKAWSLRRTGSALSPTSSRQEAQETSPTSPKDGIKRPFRLTSFIRRHQSSNVEDPEFSNRRITSDPEHKLPYEHSYRAQSQLNISGVHNLMVDINPGLNTVPSLNANNRAKFKSQPLSFSPVADNPFAPWMAKERPHTAESTPTTRHMDFPAFVPQPQVRNFSNSSAPAASTGAPQRMLDTSVNIQAEPEPFTSPSEFALFAEATSSLGIMPMDAVEFVPPPFTQAQSYPPLPAPRPNTTLPGIIGPNPVYLQPADPIPHLRSRSVPPAVTHTHMRSSSGSNVSTPRPATRAQAIAEALAGMDDDPDDRNDDELPDYETSQAEANAYARDEATRRARELEARWQRGRAERTRKPWRGWESNSWTQ